MATALIAVELVAFLLVLVALAAAVAARLRWRWAGYTLLALAVLPPLALAFTLLWEAVTQPAGLFDWLKYLSYALAPVLLIGVALIVWRGWPARASEWSIGRLGLCAGVLLLLMLSTAWAMVSALQSRLAALNAEAAALQQAVTPARVPEGDDAAPLYEAAADQLRDGPADRVDMESLSDRYFDTDKPLDVNDPVLLGFLARRQGALELLRRAAQRPAFNPPPQRVELNLSQVGSFRRSAAMLALSARFHAAKGQAGPAIADTAAIFRVADHTAASDSIIITQLVAYAIEGIATKTLDHVLQKVTPTEADLKPLLALSPVSHKSRMQRTLVGEQAYAFAEFAKMGDTYFNGYLALALDDELAGYRGMMSYGQELLQRPYPLCLDGWAEFETTARNGTPLTFERGGETIQVTPAPLTKLVMPGLAKTVEAMARSDANRRVSRFAAAVALHRAKTGKYPQQAADLVPGVLAQVPNDPYDGQPLRFQTRGAGVVVYSVGPNRTDDGGVPFELRAGDLPVRIGPTDAAKP